MILTNQDLKERLDLFGVGGYRSLQTEFLDIWCASENYSDAIVEVTQDELILDVQVVSTTTTLPYPISITLSDHTTLSSLAAEIRSYDDWSAILYVRSDADPTSLMIQPPVSCLGYENRIDLKGQKSFLLTKVASRSQDFIEDYCNRHFEQDEYTEILSGDGNNKLVISNYPLDSITSIEILSDDSWETVDSTYYNFDEPTGIVYNKEGVWKDGFENYRVVYTGGYSEIPEALRDLILEVAAVLWNRVGSNPKVSREKIGSYNSTFIEEFMTPEIKDRISYWARKDL